MIISAYRPEPLPLTARRAFVILLWYFGTQLFVGVAVGIVVVIAASVSGLDPQVLLARSQPALVMPATLVGLAFGGVVMVWKARRSFPGAYWPTIVRALGWYLGDRRTIVIAAAGGILFSTGYSHLVIRAFPPSPDQSFGPFVTAASVPGWPRIVWIGITLFLAPPLEEFLFRGLLFTGFARSWGPWVACLGVTTLFTLAHLAEVRTYWPALGGIAILGVATMAARLWTGSLGPAVAVHAGYNLGVVIAVLSGVA